MDEKDDHKSIKDLIVSVRDVYKSFDDNNVLNGVYLDLYKGENIVVMGRSGSGKSVLIKIIIGLMKPDQGVVKILGKEVHKLSKQELIELRLKIGFLFQSNALYDSMTVRENLEFPLIRNVRDISQEKINKAVDDNQRRRIWFRVWCIGVDGHRVWFGARNPGDADACQ